ncbi:hypothetical protein [Nonomuraea harbinensis]|uniref:Uncharacterized protein n=1 Tax=Nonomuraea harbinensis TaxID=1286938 RepID=A0ABW1BWX1_9ACTN|nr:hypothetical protein [Nonomuraea harbinensis]
MGGKHAGKPKKDDSNNSEKPNPDSHKAATGRHARRDEQDGKKK